MYYVIWILPIKKRIAYFEFFGKVFQVKICLALCIEIFRVTEFSLTFFFKLRKRILLGQNFFFLFISFFSFPFLKTIAFLKKKENVAINTLFIYIFLLNPEYEVCPPPHLELLKSVLALFMSRVAWALAPPLPITCLPCRRQGRE